MSSLVWQLGLPIESADDVDVPDQAIQLAARFTELVGESAIRYVTRWQMNAARSRLAGSDQTVAEVAHAFGYESEAAFNRAFKRHVGISPGAARRAR